MAKEMFSFRVDSGLRDAIAARASSESRSVSNMVEVLLLAALTERGGTNGGAAVGEERGSFEADVTPMRGSAPPRSVSADVAATIPGVTVASAICAVSPPGRSRPSCSLPVKHESKHSWEVS